jgi:hypothetical protein
MPGVVEVPVVVEDATLRHEVAVELGARVGSEDVEGRRLDATVESPVDRSAKDVAVIAVEAEDEARIHHHTEAMKLLDGGAIVAAGVVPLAMRQEVALS